IPRLSRIKSLGLALAKNITTNDLDYLHPLPSLEILTLNGQRITDVQIQRITESSPHLKEFHLHWCRDLTGDVLVHLANLPHLEALEFSETKLTKQGVEAIGKMRKLKHLNVSTDTDAFGLIDQLRKLPKLDSAHLGGEWLGDSELKELADHPTLRELRLLGTSISDEGLRHLTGLDKLEYLRIFESSNVTDEGLKYLESLETLRRLDLKETGVTTEGVAELKQALPKCKIEIYSQ
ncbi:MAG: hypothetical protein KDA84_08980, partial [Planctomycetaceae bacterium]|nr:hypothetical protein [Planctomycetaceae bacterium]